MPAFKRNDNNSIGVNSDPNISLKDIRERLDSNVINTKDRQQDMIASNISGMAWSIDYYNQVLSINQEPTSLDVNTTPSIQKYSKIENLEIYLNDSIDNTAIEDIEVTGKIQSSFVVYKDDVVITKLLDGRHVMFSILETNVKHYQLSKIYDVTIGNAIILDNHLEYFKNLESKVIKHLVYDKDHMSTVSKPLLTKKEYVDRRDLKSDLNRLEKWYVKEFFDKTLGVFRFKTNKGVYLDTLLNKFVSGMLSQSDHPVLIDLKTYDYNIDNIVDYTIWDVVTNRDIDLLEYTETKLGFIYTPRPVGDLRLIKLNTLSIYYVIDYLRSDPLIPEIIGDDNIIDSIDMYPIKKPDDSYVLSSYFYDNNRQECGILENALLNYLEGDTITDDDLYTLLDTQMKWSTLEKLYLTPMLIVLIKNKLRS